jgi:hypothetical protein
VEEKFAKEKAGTKKMIIQADGPLDGRRSPRRFGEESNWLETIPGKSWFPCLRLYGPLEPWFDKTWRPSEIELDK